MFEFIKLQISDEVNAKFVGLPAEARRYLYNKSKIFNPANRFIPSVRLGRWDGKEIFFTMSGESYINLLGPQIDYITEQNIEIEIEDLRTYNRSFDFEPITNEYLSDHVWPIGHELAGQRIILRDHETEAANMFLSNLQGIGALPTGSGKSLLTAVLSKKVEKYGRSIVIVPSKDFITQTEQYYLDLGLDVGVYYGDRKQFFKTHTICTWQSLERLRESPIDIGLDVPITFDIFIKGLIAVIVDECLASETKISTPYGDKNIEELQAGDTVWSFNESIQQFVPDTVEKLHHNLSISSEEKMFEIEMENGATIQITGNHKVLTQRGWIKVKYLSLQDEIYNYKT